MLAASVAVPASSACGLELAASACGLCGGRFASRNELFRHLRSVGHEWGRLLEARDARLQKGQEGAAAGGMDEVIVEDSSDSDKSQPIDLVDYLFGSDSDSEYMMYY